ncbi:pyridine nucleotide-disulfide oxidoreductase family protein, partial [Vibrio parahaemolyticus V-223/04]
FSVKNLVSHTTVCTFPLTFLTTQLTNCL